MNGLINMSVSQDKETEVGSVNDLGICSIKRLAELVRPTHTCTVKKKN